MPTDLYIANSFRRRRIPVDIVLTIFATAISVSRVANPYIAVFIIIVIVFMIRIVPVMSAQL